MWLLAAAVVALTALAGAGSALAHTSAPAAAAAAASDRLALRGCWMTVGFVPRPLTAVELALRRPLAATQTFYGGEPLAGVWALRCSRAVVRGRRLRDVVVSLVAAPRGLTGPDAAPLANFFDHALLRVDTNARRLARTLAANGVPARHLPVMRYRHSETASSSTGRLDVPGQYRLAVRATVADPTNPHDHRNRFGYRRADGAAGAIELRADDAADRFCLAGLGGCSVALAARSAGLQGLLGDGAQARVGFDHDRVPRIELAVSRG